MGVLRIVKLTISLAYFGVNSVLGKSQRDERLIILYYHAVRRHEISGFRAQVRIMTSYGEIVGADDVSPANGRPKIAITFDDAFQCVFDNAIPVLSDSKVPCTVFVPTAKIGGAADWEMEAYAMDKGEVIATAETIKQMQSPLVKFGAHSDTHPRLSRIGSDLAKREISSSKQKLEQLMSGPVELFAFPYGDYDETVLRLSAEAGYRFVYSIGPGEVVCGDAQMLRARVAVDPTDHPVEFWLKIRGAYSWMPLASRVKSRLLALFGRNRTQAA